MTTAAPVTPRQAVNGGVSVTADYDLDWATLTSISAWRIWQFNPPQDSDTSPLDIYQVGESAWLAFDPKQMTPIA